MNTYTDAQIAALVAAGIDLNEFFGAAKPAKEDDRNKEARAHNYQARMTRRENTVRGGLTKAERREIAAANREELAAALKVSKAAYNRKWTALVKAHKAA